MTSTRSVGEMRHSSDNREQNGGQSQSHVNIPSQTSEAPIPFLEDSAPQRSKDISRGQDDANYIDRSRRPAEPRRISTREHEQKVAKSGRPGRRHQDGGSDELYEQPRDPRLDPKPRKEKTSLVAFRSKLKQKYNDFAGPVGSSGLPAVYDDDYCDRDDQYNSHRFPAQGLRQPRYEYTADERRASQATPISPSPAQIDLLQHKQHDEISQLKLQIAQLERTMESRELSLRGQELDDAIQTHFISFWAKIRTWTADYCREASSISFDRANPDMLEAFGTVMPNLSSLRSIHDSLMSGKRMRLFIRGWLALLACRDIFPTLPSTYTQHPGSEAQDLWADGESANCFKALERRIFYSGATGSGSLPDSFSTRAFNDWRALTVDLLSNMRDEDSMTDEERKIIHDIVRQVFTLIGHWMPDKVVGEAKEKLAAYLHDATKLSKMLRRQRARWSIRFPLPAERYDANPKLLGSGVSPPYLIDFSYMQDSGDRRDSDAVPQVRTRPPVEFCVTPSLWKQGSADGEGFEEAETCFALAEVTCKT